MPPALFWSTKNCSSEDFAPPTQQPGRLSRQFSQKTCLISLFFISCVYTSPLQPLTLTWFTQVLSTCLSTYLSHITGEAVELISSQGFLPLWQFWVLLCLNLLAAKLCWISIHLLTLTLASFFVFKNGSVPVFYCENYKLFSCVPKIRVCINFRKWMEHIHRSIKTLKCWPNPCDLPTRTWRDFGGNKNI
jgi:hypothetical protein